MLIYYYILSLYLEESDSKLALPVMKLFTADEPSPTAKKLAQDFLNLRSTYPNWVIAGIYTFISEENCDLFNFLGLRSMPMVQYLSNIPDNAIKRSKVKAEEFQDYLHKLVVSDAQMSANRNGSKVIEIDAEIKLLLSIHNAAILQYNAELKEAKDMKEREKEKDKDKDKDKDNNKLSITKPSSK